MIVTRIKAEKLLKRDLILTVNPGKIVRYADPPLDFLHIRTKRLHRNQVGRFLSRIIRAPYELFAHPGSWGLRGYPFEEHRAYRKVLDLYENRQDFRRSGMYRQALRHLENHGHFTRKKRAVHSVEELDDLFRNYLLDLIESMEREGYCSTKAEEHGRVMIDARGELLKTQRGRHRFAAAQLTGVTSVPVIVFRIHRTWLKTVQGGFRGEKLENLRRALREVEARYQ